MSKLDRVYISGPMTGQPFFNSPMFHQAEAYLRREHNVSIVFNPARADEERAKMKFMHKCPTGSQSELKEAYPEFDLRRALAVDLSFILLEAEAILMLPGWEGSHGARAEHYLARALGLKVGFFSSTSVWER
jgi:hypothetical protein